MADPRTVAYDDLESLAGREVGVSDWHTIDQDRVNMFAEATGDHQWIHVDVERATKELGSPIAHGFLTLSLLPHLGSSIPRSDPEAYKGMAMGINYGLDKVRFPNPVLVGSRIRATVTLGEVTDIPAGKQATVRYTVEIDGVDKPACVAESVVLLLTD